MRELRSKGKPPASPKAPQTAAKAKRAAAAAAKARSRTKNGSSTTARPAKKIATPSPARATRSSRRLSNVPPISAPPIDALPAQDDNEDDGEDGHDEDDEDEDDQDDQDDDDDVPPKPMPLGRMLARNAPSRMRAEGRHASDDEDEDEDEDDEDLLQATSTPTTPGSLRSNKQGVVVLPPNSPHPSTAATPEKGASPTPPGDKNSAAPRSSPHPSTPSTPESGTGTPGGADNPPLPPNDQHDDQGLPSSPADSDQEDKEGEDLLRASPARSDGEPGGSGGDGGENGGGEVIQSSPASPGPAQDKEEDEHLSRAASPGPQSDVEGGGGGVGGGIHGSEHGGSKNGAGGEEGGERGGSGVGGAADGEEGGGGGDGKGAAEGEEGGGGGDDDGSGGSDDEDKDKEDDPPPIDKKKLAALKNLDTHQKRNPGQPAQPLPKNKGKGKERDKGNAERSTLALQRETGKDERAEAEAEVNALRQLVVDTATQIAEKYRLPIEEVHKIVSAATKFKKSRAYNEFNAKVWRRGQELNQGKAEGDRFSLKDLQARVQAEADGTWTDDELKKLKEDYLEYRVQKESGTRATNAEASKDVTKTADFIFDELVRVGHRTGARGFCVLAGSSATDTIAPTVVGTTESVRFLRDIYDITPDAFATKFSQYSSLNASNEKEEASQKRGSFVKGLGDGLKTISGKDLKINYVNYDEVVRAGFGYEIVGWPADIPMQAPSTMGAGGSANQAKLLELLRAGTLCWRKVPEDELKELRKKYAGKRGRGKKAVKEPLEEEEADVSSEEPAPRKAAKKPAKKQRKDEEEDGGKAKAGGKRKRDAGEEEVAKKKRKKKAEKAAAGEEEADDEDAPPTHPKKKSKSTGKVVEAVEGGGKKEKAKESEGRKKRTRSAAAAGGEDEDSATDEPKAKKAAFSKRRPGPPPGRSKSLVDSDDDKSDDEPEVDPQAPPKPYVIPAHVDMSLPANKTWYERKVKQGQWAIENHARRLELEATRDLALSIAGPSRPRPPVRKLSEIDDDAEYEGSSSSDAD